MFVTVLCCLGKAEFKLSNPSNNSTSTMSSSYSDDTSEDDYSEYDTDRPVFSDPVSDSPSEDDEDIPEDESAKDEFDLNSVRFCSTHKPGKMVRTCKLCSVALTQWELKAISPTINFRKSWGMAKKRKSYFFKKNSIY